MIRNCRMYFEVFPYFGGVRFVDVPVQAETNTTTKLVELSINNHIADLFHKHHITNGT